MTERYLYEKATILINLLIYLLTICRNIFLLDCFTCIRSRITQFLGVVTANILLSITRMRGSAIRSVRSQW